MTVVPAISDVIAGAELAVPLARYAQLVNYSECAFWGVNNPADGERACRQVWTKAQRDTAYRYLLEAQDEIEQVVNYPLVPRWIVQDEQFYACPIMPKWTRVIRGGVRAVATIALSVPVNAGSVVVGTDPVVVGPIATTVTDPDEIHVYHPGSDVEISPSSVTIAGGFVTIEIPRCRTVTLANADNPVGGWAYADLTKFEIEVDVKRVYNDPSSQATFIWPHACSGSCAASGCTEYTQTGCIYVVNSETGILNLQPGTYSGGVWSKVAFCCRGNPMKVKLNYQAGLTDITPQAEDAVLRLAHAKMPDEPCGCKVVQQLWKRDRNVPTVLTRERINCPYGLNDGAWIAWRFAQAMRVWRGGTV
jgi:hypothetical protein